ncbi:MAG TPA: helix-turn-helix domain-containing protein [Sphingobium sp.]
MTKQHRSSCPVSIALDLIGDRWSLLVVRDLLFRGPLSFSDFEGSPEGIAPNILTARLRALESSSLITRHRNESDGRRWEYRLTTRGLDLADVVVTLMQWSSRYEQTILTADEVALLNSAPGEMVAVMRARWKAYL